MIQERGKKERGEQNGAEWWPPRVKKEANIEGRPAVGHQARDPEDYTSIPIAGQHPKDWTFAPKVQPTSQRLDHSPKVRTTSQRLQGF